jgi:hypothetical protein
VNRKNISILIKIELIPAIRENITSADHEMKIHIIHYFYDNIAIYQAISSNMSLRFLNLQRNESISDDSSGESENDDELLPFSNVLQGRIPQKPVQESISDSSSDSCESESTSSYINVRRSLDIPLSPTHHRQPSFVTKRLGSDKAERAPQKPINLVYSEANSQLDDISRADPVVEVMQSSLNQRSITSTIPTSSSSQSTRKRPRPINISGSNGIINQPSAEAPSLSSMAQTANHLFKASTSSYQSSLHNIPTSSSSSSTQATRPMKHICADNSKAPEIRSTYEYPRVQQSSTTNHIRFVEVDDDDVSSVISEDISITDKPFSNRIIIKPKSVEQPAPSQIPANHATKVDQPAVIVLKDDSGDEYISQVTTKMPVDMDIALDDNADTHHQVDIEAESEVQPQATLTPTFQPIPLRNISMISPTSRSSVKVSSLSEAESSFLWRNRIWPSKAVHSFTRVLTRCIPSVTTTTMTSHRKKDVRLEINWDEKCFSKLPPSYTRYA